MKCTLNTIKQDGVKCILIKMGIDTICGNQVCGELWTEHWAGNCPEIGMKERNEVSMAGMHCLELVSMEVRRELADHCFKKFFFS